MKKLKNIFLRAKHTLGIDLIEKILMAISPKYFSKNIFIYFSIDENQMIFKVTK